MGGGWGQCVWEGVGWVVVVVVFEHCDYLRSAMLQRKKARKDYQRKDCLFHGSAIQTQKKEKKRNSIKAKLPPRL